MAKRVLVVDDDPAILEVITIILAEEGYEVYVDDGSHWKDYPRSPVDLVLLDIWMHGADGRAIASELRNHPAIVILMSAHSDGEAAVTQAGADGFIAKPFELEELVSLVNSHLHSVLRDK